PMKQAILRKANESARLIDSFFAEQADQIAACAETVALRLRTGGRVFVMGNGGFCCDAQHIAVEFQHPIIEKRKAFVAIHLGIDAALASAIGNDADFTGMLRRQLELLATPRDIAIGISTSGASSNVNRALRYAKERE